MTLRVAIVAFGIENRHDNSGTRCHIPSLIRTDTGIGILETPLLCIIGIVRRT